MKCMFCLQEKPDTERSKEHIIQEALGSRSLVTYDVCRPCNSVLGHTVDSKLVNASLSEFVRWSQGIKGKSGVPNPFKRGAVDADEGRPVRVILDENGRPQTARVIFKPMHEKSEDGTKSYSSAAINADEAENVAQLRKQLQGMVNSNPDLEGKVKPQVTEDHVRELMETGSVNIDGMEMTTNRSAPKMVSGQFSIPEDDYKPALVKIIYEMAHRWLGPDWVDDPAAAVLRDIVMQAAIGPVNVEEILSEADAGYVGIGAPDVGADLGLWEDEPHHHRVFMQQSRGIVVIAVKILTLFTGGLVVTRDPTLYKAENMFVSVNPENGEARETTLREEVERLATKMVETNRGPRP